MADAGAYLFVLATIVLTVYGQVVIKWQVLKVGALPAAWADRVDFIATLLTNMWVLSALAAAFCASLTWMAAMSRLQLSHAYPFMSLAFVLVMVLSAIFFNEPLTTAKLVGVVLVIAGLAIGSRG